MSLRIGQILRLLGTLLLVAFLIYVGSAVYYAFQISAPSGQTPSVVVGSGNSFQISSTYNLTDPGPYTISGLTLASHLNLPNLSVPIDSITSPVTLPGFGSAQVVLSFRIPLDGAFGIYGPLLVNSSSLPLEIWVNASYAHLAGISIFTQRTLSWGAPFSGLVVSFQPPKSEPNGTVALLVATSFLDRSPLGLDGTLTVSVQPAAGRPCATIEQSVHVAAGSPFSDGTTAYLPSGCSPGGGSYSIVWAGSGFEAGLPAGRVP
ncbi:MAG: hypothetical protein ACYDFT_02945 [Thermoplasmata archaeon]